jgi:transcriptional regulator with XRE-family HTH domain
VWRRGLPAPPRAKHAGVSQPYLWELEAGQKTNPGIVVLRKLATALGVPVAHLLN